MRIERVLLLALTGSAALFWGAACEVHVEGSTGSKPPQAAPPPSAPPAAPAAAAAPSAAQVPAAAAPAPAPAPAPPGKTLQLHLGGGGAPPPASGGGAPAAPSAAPAACLDKGAAAAAACGTLQAPSPTCAPFSAATQKCGGFTNNFAPKVAAAAVACLASSTSAQLCDATRPLTCAKTALAQACPDPTVAQLCQIAAVPCKTNAADCTSLLSGLNGQGQQAIAQCVAQGCTAGLAGCIDALR